MYDTLAERFDRDTVEPVVHYINEVTDADWFGVGVDLGSGTRYISNVKMFTYTGPLGGVFCLIYLEAVASAYGLTDSREHFAHLGPALAAKQALLHYVQNLPGTVAINEASRLDEAKEAAEAGKRDAKWMQRQQSKTARKE